MKFFKENKGFTLIELLLVVVIIGLMLAVIVPRAWRANIDAKYGLVRQTCSELASYAHNWVETEINSQDEEYTSPASSADYFAYLCGSAGGAQDNGFMWVAAQAAPGWVSSAIGLTGRQVNNAGTAFPTNSVKSYVPVDKLSKNPFNGLSVFAVENDPSAGGASAIPGAICSGYATEWQGNWKYFGLVFQGTENTTNGPTNMHGDMEATSIGGLRNGTFMARVIDP